MTSPPVRRLGRQIVRETLDSRLIARLVVLPQLHKLRVPQMRAFDPARSPRWRWPGSIGIYNEVVRGRFSLPEADALYRALIIASFVLISTASTACGVRSDHGRMSLEDANASAQTASILLFNGTGASPNDVAAVEAILKNNHLSFDGEVFTVEPDGTITNPAISSPDCARWKFR
jgi:hypothetical protein